MITSGFSSVSIHLAPSTERMTEALLWNSVPEFGISGWSTAALKERNFEDNRLIKYRHTLFYCTSLYLVLLILNFLQIEGLRQPWVKQVYWCHFSNNICSLFVSVSLLVILAIFRTFALLLYLLCWSVINDLWLSESSDDGEHFSVAQYFKLRYVHCFLDIMLLHT